MARNDFNRDGRSDLLLRDFDSGWLTNWVAAPSGELSNNGANAARYLTSDWDVAATGDFNGDGFGDIVLHHKDGWLTDWLGIAGGAFVNNGSNSTAFISSDWHVAGTADFNRDGRDDLLLTSDSGWVTNWLGTPAGGFVNNGAVATWYFAPDWHVIATGDFNGDDYGDMLIRNDDGWVTNWLGTTDGGFLNNGANASLYFTADWRIAGTGDFNGDGYDDILLRSDEGWLTNWLGTSSGGFVNNGSIAARYFTPDWVVVDTADYNGDGRDDILLRSGAGWLTNWLATDAGAFADNSANFSVYVTNTWQPQSESGEINIPILGWAASETLTGTWGRDVIDGGEGNDLIFGLGGDDQLYGGGGTDIIHGGAGNDVLAAGQSNDNDIFYGDAGADVFYFTTFTSAQIQGYVPQTSATIMDFVPGVDTIHLHLFGISTNDENLYWLVTDGFSGLNRIEARFDGSVLQVDYNGDKIADLIVNIASPLSPADFTMTYDPWGY
jgi:hypothetical protein